MYVYVRRDIITIFSSLKQSKSLICILDKTKPEETFDSDFMFQPKPPSAYFDCWRHWFNALNLDP